MLINLLEAKGKQFPIVICDIDRLTDKEIYLIMSRGQFEVEFLSSQQKINNAKLKILADKKWITVKGIEFVSELEEEAKLILESEDNTELKDVKELPKNLEEPKEKLVDEVDISNDTLDIKQSIKSKEKVETLKNNKEDEPTIKNQQNNQKLSSEPNSSSEAIQHDLLEAINKHQKEIKEIENYLNPNIVHNIEQYIEKAQQEYEKNLQSTPPEKKKYIVTRSVKVGRSETKWFLEKQYQGRCQVCGFTFTKRKESGGQYFELFDWFSEKITKQKVPIVLAGSSLSLCSRCHSGVKYGSFETKLVENLEGLDVASLSFDEFVERISESIDGKDIPECYQFVEMDMYKVPIRLFGKEEFIFYTEEHFLQLYTVMRSRK